MSLLPNQIKLKVGEKEFTTSKETLQESRFFSALLTRWEHNALPDGSFFIDGDGDLFEHILRYLRRSVLPVFYTKDKGHDYAMYAAILQEARYYQIDRLRKWIETKRYLEAVKIKVTTQFYYYGSNDEPQPNIAKSLSADTEVQQTQHYAMLREGVIESFHKLQIVQVIKEVVFDHDLCLSGLEDTESDGVDNHMTTDD